MNNALILKDSNTNIPYLYTEFMLREQLNIGCVVYAKKGNVII